MGDNLDKVFVEVYWGYEKDLRLEWALNHFDKDKTQLMIFPHSYVDYNEEGYRNKTKSYFLPRCAEENFKVEVLLPAADEVGSDYAANLRKVVTRHGINKLLLYYLDIDKNAISKVFNEAPHLSCKVWFIEWIGRNGKLESTRWYNPSHAQMMEEALVENENLKKMINEKTSRCEKVEKELLMLKKTIEDETSRCENVENELPSTLAETRHGFTNLYEFSYAELKEATNNFSDEYKIGEGGYGSVYKGVIHCTTVAIKVLNKENDEGEKDFNQEIETLQKVRHPSLVTLIGACPENCAFVYEFMPKGNLDDCLKNAEDKKYLSWRKRIQIASNICSALVFLHHTKPHGIVHGDLKPANILLDSTYTCKLSDFGTCRRLNLTDTTVTPNHKTKDPRGTYFYFDPEYLETNTITAQSDVFAFGVVLLQLVTGREARRIKKVVKDALGEGKLNEVVDASANWPIEVAEKMGWLGLRCIKRSRKDRPDSKELWVTIKSMESLLAPL